MNRRLPWLLAAATVVGVCALPDQAQAGGYDTPILYSARHMGMGGAAQAYVDDPSALFHNPAGLAHVPFADVMADVSMIIGTIQSSPRPDQQSIEADTTIAPFFLVGGAIRATDWLSFGFGVYPVASAGATYNYETATGTPVIDETTLIFFEFSPGVAVNLPYGIKLGAGYRVSLVTLERTQEATGIEFDAAGTNFTGFRVGAQWEPIDEFALGITYRHKTETTVGSEEGKVLAQDARNLQTEFILPSKLSTGIKGGFAGVGAAVDFEYTFQSQNDRVDFSGELASTGTEVTLPNIFEWQDSITLRTGVEYDIDVGVGVVTPRVGYIWDQQVSSKKYPSAFGTPPDVTHTATAGIGYDGGAWETNLAYAFRTGATTVEESDLPGPDTPPEDRCSFCAYPGDYSLTMHGLYVDFNWKFELGDWTIDRDYWEDPDTTADVE